MNSYTIYILTSIKIPKTYVGYTSNLARRLREHNAGRVKATKHFCPWNLLHKEIVTCLSKAKKREQYWKSAAGRKKLKLFFG
ncbi:MAG: GIY-YIG nuclease family protein [bacterium]|nr:GIY-YIG nuclease family protein [bacterium]